MAAPEIGTGSTITFGTSGFTANIMSIDWSGRSRPSIASSHLGTTTNATFIVGDLHDPGSIDIEMQFDGTVALPMTAAAETVTVEWGATATTDTWACTAFMTDFSASAPLEDLMTATASLKCSGAITLG